MQKKILILNDKHHSNIGGTETYTKNLIKILTDNGHEVFEINFFSEKNKILNETHKYQNIIHKIKFYPNFLKIFKLPFLLWKFIPSTLKFNKLINKIIKDKKIDIVIDNTVKSIPYIKRKKVNYIWVAHFDIIKIYREQKSLITKFVRWVSLRPNKFKYKKIVLFTKKDKETLISLNKKINPDNIYFCPLSHKNLLQISNLDVEEKINQGKNIIYMGRLDQNQKNINFLVKLAEKLIKNSYIYIYIYGNGPDKNIIIENPGIKYQGPFKKDEVDEILKKAKLLILPSFYEGFPYVVVEALSNGVPCLVANTFNNASYLIDDTRGRCIDNFEIDNWIKEIEFFKNLNNEEYLKFAKNALNFAKENLIEEKFQNFWLNIIKKD